MTSTSETVSAGPSKRTHHLKHPFTTADGKQVTEILFRRARAKDILAFEEELKRGGSDTGVTLAFLASVNGMSLDDLGEIDAEDMIEVGAMVVDFLPEQFKGAREE
ncbi:hypothetical protein W911_06895 [Hyphomicrobium nitrativorans NL23]|uniref:Phage tail assembly protein n=1 Tax=Hyphomicrobium nitrativorans NL23 TaxID=1029756 RepID=V5SHU1_9HYPH|nr:phage tail assembly protein [Hyphomicrobium nitrativorans]AHB50067.1 hypothetical protein W911_06895 [Hyphomicrobium nitrativorans NL23]